MCQRGCFCQRPLAGKVIFQLLAQLTIIDIWLYLIHILNTSSYCILPQKHILQHIVNLCYQVPGDTLLRRLGYEHMC